jgi:hypothetical protein
VNVGDSPPWTIIGPTTTLDMIQRFGSGIMSQPPMREQLKNKDRLEGLKQDRYGVYHLMIEGHFSEAGMGSGTPIHFMAFARNEMVRAVTNYISDDGWLRNFTWWNGGYASDLLSKVPAFQGKVITFGHGKVSDVIICKSYVSKKYVADDGSHRIDLIVWSEDIEGIPEQDAEANIILSSRGK